MIRFFLLFFTHFRVAIPMLIFVHKYVMSIPCMENGNFYPMQTHSRLITGQLGTFPGPKILKKLCKNISCEVLELCSLRPFRENWHSRRTFYIKFISSY